MWVGRLGTSEGRTSPSDISVCPGPNMGLAHSGHVLDTGHPSDSPKGEPGRPWWDGEGLQREPECGILAGSWEAPGSKAQARMRGLIPG